MFLIDQGERKLIKRSLLDENDNPISWGDVVDIRFDLVIGGQSLKTYSKEDGEVRQDGDDVAFEITQDDSNALPPITYHLKASIDVNDDRFEELLTDTQWEYDFALIRFNIRPDEVFDHSVDSGSIKFATIPKEPTVTGITVEPTSIEDEEGTTEQLDISVQTIGGADDSYTTSIDDETIATIDGNDLVSLIKEGSATITIESVFDPSVSETVVVTVSEPDEVTGITVLPSSIEGDEGDTEQLSITVETTGNATDDYTTSVGDETIATIDENDLVSLISDGTTEITITSTFDPSVSETVSITVQAVDVPPSDAPTISNIDEDENEVTVTYTGVDGATFYQYRINQGSSIGIVSNPFIVDGLDTNTTYEIEIRGGNVHGTGPWSDITEFTTLQVDAPDTAPSIDTIDVDLETVEISRGSVAGAEGYEYRLNSGLAVDIGTTNPFEILSLSQDTEYTIELRAYNDGGPGPWSDPEIFTTDAEVTEAPTITNIDESQESVEVTFDEAEYATSHEYRVNQGSTNVINDNPFTANNLEPDTTYELEIRGRNEYGAGPWTDVEEFTTLSLDVPEDAPEISNIDVDLESVEVTRTSVSGVDGYEYRLDGELDVVDVGTTNPFTVEDLSQDTTYEIEVRAYNDGGGGPFSDSEEFTTDAEVEDAPTIDSTTNNGDDQTLDVVITGVDYADSYDWRINQGTVTNVGDNTEFSISGLEDDEGYELEVRGRNEYGAGPWSDIETFDYDVTPPTISDDSLDVDDVTLSGFTVSFTKATDNLTAGVDLVYEYHEGSESNVNDIDWLKDNSPSQTGIDVGEFVIDDRDEGEAVFFNILVKDDSENASMYQSDSEVTFEQEVTDVLIVDGEGDEQSDFQLDAEGLEEYQLDVDVETLHDADDSVTWYSSDTNVATVDQTGFVTYVGEGTATITAESDFDDRRKDTVSVFCVDHTLQSEHSSEEQEFDT